MAHEVAVSSYDRSATAVVVAKAPIDVGRVAQDLANGVDESVGASELGGLFVGVKLPPYQAYFRGSSGSLIALQTSTDPRLAEVTVYSRGTETCYRDLVGVIRPLLRDRSLGIELQDLSGIHSFPKHVGFASQLSRLVFREHMVAFLLIPAVISVVDALESGISPRLFSSVTFLAAFVGLCAAILYIVGSAWYRSRVVQADAE